MPETSSKCRLCLSSVCGRGIDLFKGDNGINYSVHMALMIMLNVELEEIPEWPRKACLDCVVMLKKILKFRCSVIANNKSPRLVGTSQETTIHDLLGALQQHQLWLDDREEKVLNAPDAVDIAVVDLTSGPSQPQINAKSQNIVQSLPQPSSSSAALFSSSSSSSSFLSEEEGLFSDFMDFTSDSESDSISSLEFGPTVKHPRPLTAISSAAPPAKPQSQVSRSNKLSVVRRNSTVLRKEEETLEALMVEMRLFVCKECDEDCQSLPSLRTHVRELHGNNDDYKICCNRSLFRSSVATLFFHIRLHQKGKAFRCTVCGECYPDNASLAEHMSLPHAEEVGPFVCEFCGQGFDIKTGLSKHMIEHNKLTCEHCEKEFKFGASLRQHILEKHKNLVNYVCHICGKGFATESRMKTHLKDHGGPDKPKRVRTGKRTRPQKPKKKKVTPFWA